ncbi:MAG: DoxX family membrane protein [Sphingobacteriaceae bacterium]
MNKKLLHFSRLFVGILFIFSGLIKANDPLGFGYKLQEYFEVFHCTFLNDYAVAVAILLCSLEMVLGMLLLLGFWAKKISWGLLLLILFFTFLTFYSAFFKVVTSCGCFGDAIPLSPWQSFSKDLVLLLFIIIIFTQRAQLKPIFNSVKAQRIILGTSIFLSLSFGLYTYNYLPIIDFLPYKVGNNIPQLMKMPPGAAMDIYETTYVLKNKKTGENKKMSDQEYLKTGIWKDDDWETIGNPETKLIKKGYEVKIKDLKITDSHDVDYTSEIIEHPYYTLAIVAYDLHKTNVQALANLNVLAVSAAENYTIRTIMLTSTSVEQATAFSKAHRLLMDIFYADSVPLKSMVRANPGILLLKDGIIVGKWHYHNMPTYNELASAYFSKN